MSSVCCAWLGGLWYFLKLFFPQFSDFRIFLLKIRGTDPALHRLESIHINLHFPTGDSEFVIWREKETWSQKGSYWKGLGSRLQKNVRLQWSPKKSACTRGQAYTWPSDTMRFKVQNHLTICANGTHKKSMTQETCSALICFWCAMISPSDTEQAEKEKKWLWTWHQQKLQKEKLFGPKAISSQKGWARVNTPTVPLRTSQMPLELQVVLPSPKS